MVLSHLLFRVVGNRRHADLHCGPRASVRLSSLKVIVLVFPLLSLSLTVTGYCKSCGIAGAAHIHDAATHIVNVGRLQSVRTLQSTRLHG